MRTALEECGWECKLQPPSTSWDDLLPLLQEASLFLAIQPETQEAAIPPLRFDDGRSPVQAPVHQQAAGKRNATWKAMSTKCMTALFDTPLLWPSSPTFDSKLYSPCAFHTQSPEPPKVPMAQPAASARMATHDVPPLA